MEQSDTDMNPGKVGCHAFEGGRDLLLLLWLFNTLRSTHTLVLHPFLQGFLTTKPPSAKMRPVLG